MERSLRVLDGAVVIFSGVEGVQPQSETVWRQADRYSVPRIAFINKLDRAGADPVRVLGEIHERLRAPAAFLNLPHGLEDRLNGVIDLPEMRWCVFDPASRGRELTARPIPLESVTEAAGARDKLVQLTAEAVDWLADLHLRDEPISGDTLRRAIREATLAGALVPVLCGAALRDLGVRPVLDAVCDFLPAPRDRRPAVGHVPSSGVPTERMPSPTAPFSALVFKVVASQAADSCWLRVYSGTLEDGGHCFHPRTGHNVRMRRFLRLHADRTEPVEKAQCGDIIAVQGIRHLATGDTLCALSHPITFEPMHFPEPVVSLAVEAATSSDRERLIDVVSRLTREDPTFRYRTDEETGELILSGMGELHLEILRNRMCFQFNVTARFGRPRVTYRETVTGTGRGIGEFDRKIGDSRVTGHAEVEVFPRPRPAGELGWLPFELDFPAGGRALDAALREEAVEVVKGVCASGGAGGNPVVDVRVRLLGFGSNDPPDPKIPLRAAMALALRRALQTAGLLLLEPVMRLEVRVPQSSLGAVVNDLAARRAELQETELSGTAAAVRALVPLASMFGYSTDLRSMTQGQGDFSMEPFDYQPVPGRG